MSTLVKYNNKQLVPISSISINHTMGANTNGQCVRPTYSIDLNGYLLFNMGSPNSSGQFGDYDNSICEVIDEDERLNSLVSKHCALGSLFSENYHELEIGTSAGSPNLVAYPRITNLSIGDTSNPNYWLYTVSMEADNLYCDGAPMAPTGCPCVKSFEESWDISYDEAEVTSESGNNRLFRINHSISAVGVGTALSGELVQTPYTCAKNFVCERSGPNVTVPQFCVTGFSCSGTKYNYFESHSMDVANGSYSLTESWICTTGSYIETYSVESSEESSQACPTVSIQGSIRGFEIRSTGGEVTQSKYQNAKSQWDNLVSTSGVYARATGITSIPLDTYPTSATVGRNTFTGEITYSYNYRRLPFKWLPSAKFESVNFNANWGEDAFSSVQILEGGEVLLPMNYTSTGVLAGKKLNRFGLNIEAVYLCGTGISSFGPRFSAPYSGEIQAVVDYYDPTAANHFTVVESQNESFNPQQGTYSYAISWVSQQTSACSLF